MFRCNFCIELDIEEYSGIRFCYKHKAQHDTVHTGEDEFTESFSKSNKQGEADIKLEISRRIKTLKIYKHKFTADATEYIKSIQTMLSQKIISIDKLSQFYIDLLMKNRFDSSDSEIVDKLLSTTLKLKPLKIFFRNKFQDYIQQNLIEPKELVSEKLYSEEPFKILSTEGEFLFDVIKCCVPQNIPEGLLRNIAMWNIGKIGWDKAKEELINLQIVKIDDSSNLWSINEKSMIGSVNKEISAKVNAKCLEYCANRLKINNKIEKNEENYLKIRKMLVHVEKFVDNAKIESNNLFQVLLNLGRVYDLLEFNDTKAEKYYLKCLEFNELIIPGKHLDQASIYIYLGNLYLRRSDYDKAENYFLQYLKVQTHIIPTNYPNQSDLNMILANLYVSKADYAKAEIYVIQCLETTQQFPPENKLSRARIYMSLGTYHMRKVDYNQAEKYFLECRKIIKQILLENCPEQLKHFIKSGILYNDKADCFKDKKFCLKYLEIREKILPEDYPDKISLYVSLGNLFLRKLDYDAAEKYYLKELKICEKILPIRHPDRATIYLSLGNLYLSKEDFEKAGNYFFKCLKTQKKVLLKKHPAIGLLYFSIGKLYFSKADYNIAEVYYLKSLKFYKQTLPTNYAAQTSLYMDLRNLNFRNGNHLKTNNYYLRCIMISKKILPKCNLDLACIYMNLGTLFESEEAYELAKINYLKCQSIREMLLPEDDSDRATIGEKLVNLYEIKSLHTPEEDENVNDCIESLKQLLVFEHDPEPSLKYHLCTRF